MNSNHFPDFTAFSNHLDKLGLFRMQPGLERMESMLSRLGLKRPPYIVVQVAGTNGKGSTCAMLESLAREHGFSTGLHSSPHFVSVRERIRVNGSALPEAVWTELANKLMQKGGEELSYFEFVTCLAVLAFAEAGVDIAIMETGLGGSFDATSALEADLVVFTPFDLDHQAVLGPTLAHIAKDKAGCIRQGKPVISAPQREEAATEIYEAARIRQAPLAMLPVEEASADPFLSTLLPRMRLRGAYQGGNVRLALAAWRYLLQNGLLPSGTRSPGACGTEEASLESLGLTKAWLPGRMQKIPPMSPQNSGVFSPSKSGWPHMLLDGAHNAHGLAALGLSLAREGIAPAAVIFACLEDKDLAHILPHLRSLATGPIFVPPIKGNPRAMAPEKLAARIGLNAVPVESLTKGLEAACSHLADRLPEIFTPEGESKNPLLICGSLYLLGEFYELRPECLEYQATVQEP